METIRPCGTCKARPAATSRATRCTPCSTAYARQRYQQDPELARRKLREYRQRNPEWVRAMNRKYNNRIKIEVLSHYGDLWCYCCGEDGIAFLTLDHMDNDGKTERESTGSGGGMATYRWLKSRGLPPRNFLVACYNCNIARRHGVCPHTNEDAA